MIIRVVGVGNPWATDDGAGPEVVRRLRHRLRHKPVSPAREIECLVIASPVTGLWEALDGCDLLIVVDAVCSGAEPGAVHRLDWRCDSLDARAVARASSHGLGVREVLEMAETLGRCPPGVVLWGVEAASSAPGKGLSPGVAAAVPAIVARLYNELMSLSA